MVSAPSSPEWGEFWPDWWPELESLDLEATYQELSSVDLMVKCIRRPGSDSDDEREYYLDIAPLALNGQVAEHHLRQRYNQTAFARAVEERRSALRSRAMDFSRDKIRPLNLLNLPLDILTEVFKYLHDSDLDMEGNILPRHCRYELNSQNCLRDIQNARLVCRAFCGLASPLLLPVVTVELDQASLSRIDQISQSPLIASGVRTVNVVIQYRPKEIATDLARFVELRREFLDELYWICNQRTEAWFPSSRYDDQGPLHPEFRMYQQAKDNYHVICEAWDDLLYKDELSSGDNMTLDHQIILLQWQKDYLSKHKEQRNLIVSGSFVRILSSAMARMPLCRAVTFTGGYGSSDLYRDERKAPVLLTNSEELGRSKVPPLTMCEVETLKEGAELLPARILSELPIAMHKAGASLRDLEIECFPHKGNYSFLSPCSHGQEQQVWDDLRAACQQLVMFRLNGDDDLIRLPQRQEPLSAEDQASADGFLGAMMSSPSLEVAHVNLWGYCPHGAEDNHLDRYRMGPVLGASKWPRIKRASISSVALHQSDLERLCERLSSDMEEICLCDIHLQSGSWAGALDILRRKVGFRRPEEMCYVELECLEGGEFEKFQAEFKDAKELTALCVEYVQDAKTVENPLKRLSYN